MQRAHPTQRANFRRYLAPAHAFGPWEGFDDAGQKIGNHVGCWSPFALDDGDIKIAFLRVILDGGFREISQPRAFQKAVNRLLRRANARAFLFFPNIRLMRGKADNMQRQTTRGGEGLRAFIEATALDQSIGHQRLQILRSTTLHAGGNFLGEEFKQKIGHWRTFQKLNQ